MAAAPLIHARSLVKQFGSFRAVDNVDLEVAAGEVVGFLGPNGAGKTTTMRMVTGYLMPTSGEVTLAGMDLATHPREAKRHLGYCPRGRRRTRTCGWKSFCTLLLGPAGYAVRRPGPG